VEAEKCAVIAKEVSEKQASCERDLAAAEPLVAQAEAALDTLNKKVGRAGAGFHLTHDSWWMQGCFWRRLPSPHPRPTPCTATPCPAQNQCAEEANPSSPWPKP